ncbi:anti-sigma factor [Actinophytocola sp.]|uniref:anti-sigma factor n=1 Tax=Actinophytocola sp. TaxID=1872138 RepID=UPI002ED4CE67
MTTADIHALTGAYALDAVSGVERMEFERHLAECDSCAQEVMELQETASRLALAASAPPPPALKARVMDEIRATRQAPPVTEPVPLRRRSLATRLSTVAAAVFFVAAAGLGVVVFQQNQQIDDTQAQIAQMEQILSADDAKLVPMANPDGGSVNVAVSSSQDRMMLFSEDLASAPAGKTYQVWTIADGNPRSMGFLEPNNGNAVLAVSGLSDAGAVAVTIEPDGGSPQPTSDPIMSGSLTS